MRDKELRLEYLQFQLKDLEQDYKLVVADLRVELDATTKNSLERRLAKIGQEIEKLEQEIESLEQVLQQKRTSVQEVRNRDSKVENVIFQHNQVDRIQLVPYLAKREVPSLLPYLPNRTDQEYELGQAVQKFLKQTLPHPLVCIIHGDECQSHDKFLERLQKLSIPRLLGFDPHQTKIKKYSLSWPSRLKNLDNLASILCKNLADSVLGDSFSSLEDINKTLCKYPDPIIIHTHLLTEDWQHNPESLYKFLEFWQNWPELLPGQKLIICLFIKYQIKRFPKSKGFSLTGLLSYLRLFLRRHQFRHINNNICKEIEAFKTSNYIQFDRISIICLTQLSSISRTHVENWARSEETKHFVGEAMIGQLIDAIGKMFDDWEEKTSSNLIPMDDLAYNLMNLLKSLVVTEGEVQ